MKKLGILMAAAMLFVGASAFAGTPVAVKHVAQKEATAPAKKAHKAHKKHHHTAKSKAKATAAAPKAK